MDDIILAKEKYNEAKRWSEKLNKSLENMEFFMQNGLPIAMKFPWDMVEPHIQTAYISAVETALNVQGIMYGKDCDSDQNLQQKNSGGMHSESSGDLIASEVVYDAGSGVLTCKIMAPPLLKKQSAASRYLSLVCPELQQKIIQILPPKFKKIEAAYVIFANHFSKKLKGKQPYFDNDNIAIKGLLDSIVPLVCADDAFVFCDNFYIAQPDICDFSEIIIVPKGQLLGWMQTRSELEFVKEFCGA